jgi:hypothetical protein
MTDRRVTSSRQRKLEAMNKASKLADQREHASRASPSIPGPSYPPWFWESARPEDERSYDKQEDGA